jgi:DNA-directed RNA polymerase beta subunit/intein/homing endonuclease
MLNCEAKTNVERAPKLKIKAPKKSVVSNAETEFIKETIEIEEKIKKQLDDIDKSSTDNEKKLLEHLGQYIEEPYHIIESYFEGQHLERLVRHQIESYNHFVNYQILRTIQMFNPVTIRSENDFVIEKDKYFLEVFISFTNFKLYPPQIHENNGATKIMLPQEAKLRNFTYASTMTVDINIKYVIRNTENMDVPKTIEKTLTKINIGKLPIMLKSSICVLKQNSHINPLYTGECSMDCGGYFIIKGSEKTVLGQERAAENRVYCFDGKNTAKWDWFAEIKSVPDFKCISPKQIEMMISSKNNGFGNGLFVSVPRIKQPIELFVLFRALGVESDKDITKYILLDIDDDSQSDLLNCVQASIIDANKYMTQEDAIKHITSFVAYTPLNMDKETGMRKKREFTIEVLDSDLFPHCHTLQQKLYLLGYMAKKLIQTSLGHLPPDDRDSYVNKRIELTGTLLNNLFRNYFNKLVKEMQKQIVREINNGSWRSKEDYENIVNMTNIYKIMKSTTIENGINRALATGDFSIKQSNSSKVGVAQVLNRLTYVASLSHSRRINTPLEKSGELIAPRKLHNTTWGFLCPAETPEGQSIGIVKNISYMGHITIPTNSTSLYEYVKPFLLSVNDTNSENLYKKVKVFVNGCWLGITENPMELYGDMKDKKYKGIINIYTSVIFDFKMLEIRICNDGGRLTRPVLKVKNNRALIDRDVIDRLVSKELSWNDLLTNCKLDESVIEYIDPEEQNLTMIAMKCKNSYLQDVNHIFNYTHCEIHPSTIFGVLASCIPFPEHNQAPRNTYQCLSPDELVWMADGTKKCIKDVLLGDKVLSFNPETLDITETNVVNQFVRTNEYPIYKLKTVSGREIIATEDHKLMTNKGWKTIGEMNKNIDEYKIGISINNPILNYDNNSINDKNNIIIDENAFSEKLELLEINKKTIEKYVNSLKTQNLLPLFKYERKLEIVSRIIGYLLSDGSINIYIRNGVKFTQCQFDFGREEDAIEFKKDLSILGFKPCKITENIRTFNNTSHHTFHLCYNGSFPAFLIALDVSYGKKTETLRKTIPSWIMNDTPNCRREFLKGFQGGDGCKIRWNKLNKKGYNFICGETSQQINPMYKESLINFMNQCVDILKENDIIVNNEITEKIVEDNRVKISFKISDAQSNLIKYYDTIGYAYCKTKNIQSFKIIEYLKAKNGFSKKYIESVEVIRNLYDKGMTNTEIANKLDIKTNYVSDIVRSYKNGRKISTPNIKEFNIDNWMNKDVEEKNNCIFIPIESITLEPDGLVSDIEVESDNHSFIAGSNFLSSNCAMGKQAMGVYATNYDKRMDKTAYVLNYPSRPLVDTRLMNMIYLNRIPSGTQIHVAIMTHTGYNQEDSVLVNKGSLDRGLFLATIYHTEKDEDKNIIRDEIIRCKPDPAKTKGIKFGNYDKLDPNGFIPENELVENRDVIIAKTIPIKENRNDPTKTVKFEDQSKTFRTTEETYIDKNYTGRNGDGYNFAKVRVRTLRKPVLGDKFSSRHGQKGTCGNIIQECDMPFTKNGLRPDIIINPHAIPSRMTIAQLKETLLGKVLLELGMFGDGTSFGNLDIKTICSELLKLGYESYGNEVMYNGLTGEQLETSIFIGPVFYQRLKHMVNDKQHSRSIGPMVNLTRQPAEGRSRDGGFRIGEMERDVMIAHGASRFCRERLYDVSDKYSVYVCKKCGMVAAFNEGNKKYNDFSIHLCKTCDNKTDFALVDIPYAYKLMSQELQTINVVPRIITE